MFVDYQTFNFTAHTIDGKILEFPKVIPMRCDLVIPLYTQVVREYNSTECIQAKKVYLVMYDGHLFGTDRFETPEEFVNYRNSNCSTRDCCFLLFGGCNIVIKGRRINITNGEL